jgi:cell wall-associated NlpC family hydrolase
MLKQLLVFTFIFLPLLSFQAQNAASPSASRKPVNATPGVDRTDLITFAKQYLGTPYRSGSLNPKKGFDCSGFVYYVFKKFNIDLPRSSREYKSFGTALKPEKFKVGDILVFYGYKDSSHIGHVGIICEANGMKSRFIHSTSGKAYGVTISNLDSKGYKRRFYKCIDMIKQQ